MNTHLFERLFRRRFSIAAGVIVGIAAASAWAAWFHNFTPYLDEKSSAWASSAGGSPEQRKPAALYQPRIDYLLQRVRLNGRVGESAWQSLREAADAWLLSDPIGCLNHLSGIGALGLVDEKLLDEALRHECGGVFSVAMRRADELTDPRAYLLWLTRAFRLEIERSPQSAKLALASVPPQMRWIFRFDLANAWFKKDAAGAFAALQSDSSFGLFASAWIRNDPKAGLAFFARFPETIDLGMGRSVPRSEMLCDAAAYLAKSDPAQALEILSQLPNGQQESNVRARVLQQLAVQDVNAALAAADALPGDIARINAQSQIANAIAKTQPDLAAQIRDALPGEGVRNGNQSRVWDWNDPLASAQNAAVIDDPVIRSDAMHDVAATWMLNHPADAVAYATQQSNAGNPIWVTTIADEFVDWAAPQNRGMSDVVDRFISQAKNLDSATRAIWLTELQAQPAGPGRDRLLQAMQ